MSIFSNLIGKIPIVGGLINDAGKVLPSVGQLAGGAALGPLGTVLGGAIDGSTSPLQKTIGNTAAAAEGAAGAGVGLGGLLGGGAGAATGSAAAPATGGGIGLGSLGGLLGTAKGVLGGLTGGGTSLSSLVDPAIGGAAALNAANLQKQSTDAANNAMNTANTSYTERAPLRTAGVAGLLNPGAGVDLSGLKKIASRNSFA